MYNNDTELLFPSRVILALRDERGGFWRQMVEKAAVLMPTERDHLAFVLMMVRLNGCMSCNSDSFRAMRGCTQCSIQNVRRYRGKDEDLGKQLAKALHDLEKRYGDENLDV